jgi:hypothetical protein
VNDLRPPTLWLLTTRVTAGRPTIVFRTTDAQSGVDPASLTIGYGGVLVAVGTFQRATGLAVFPLPEDVATLPPGTTSLRMISSDYQESKNVDTSGAKIMPNTRTVTAALHVVRGVSVDWLLPTGGACTPRRTRVEVTAGSPRGVAAVRFAVDGRRVATERAGDQGLWSASLRLPPGRHAITATAVDAGRATAAVRRIVRVCGA